MERQMEQEAAELKREQEEAPSKKPAPVSNQEIEPGSLIS